MSIDYQALAEAVREETEVFCGRLSCLVAVAGLVDIGRSLGLDIRPLTVRVMIFNPTFTRGIGDLNAPEAHNRMQSAMKQERAFAVKLGIGKARKGEWAGHLVAVGDIGEEDRRLVLDPTTNR